MTSDASSAQQAGDRPVAVVVRTGSPREVLRATVDALESGRSVVLATVLRCHGSAPSSPGQKLVLLSACDALGTIGGGVLEHEVVERMCALLGRHDALPEVRIYKPGPEVGRFCCGAVDVLIEPLWSACSVLVVGAGHIGRALAPLLCSLGFRVVLCDRRREILDREAPAAVGLTALVAAHDAPAALVALGEPGPASAILVVTHDHRLDMEVLEWALGKGFGFVGGVGSRSKATRLRNQLEERRVPRADIERVRMPVGVPIGARAPMEIALAVAGELVAWRGELCRSAPETEP